MTLARDEPREKQLALPRIFRTRKNVALSASQHRCGSGIGRINASPLDPRDVVPLESEMQLENSSDPIN